jgi:hypothetical protein
MAEPNAENDGSVMTLRQHGAQVVHQLSEVGGKLHPLKMKLQAGQPLSADEQAQFDTLEVEYRELERELRSLIRPRPKDPWVRGVDHLHGPEDPAD